MSALELQLMVTELKNKKAVFKDVTRNEMTCREFILPFLVTAIKHLQSEEESLVLHAKELIHGTRAYGPVDYTINLGRPVICVTEVKKEDTFEKGKAQNVAQMHTAAEVSYPLKSMLRITQSEYLGNRKTQRR